MNNYKYKTYVWSFLGRLSHWMLVGSFFACYISSFYENLLTLHISIGIVVFGMLLMKIVWGVIGPKYARWSDFDFKIKHLKYYFIEKIKYRYRDIPAGHNPASSWFAFLVTWFGIFCCLSGFILYGVQEGNGLFSFLNASLISKVDIINNVHYILVYILLFMIAAHITGVLIEQFYHKTNMVMAMVSGFKKAKGEDISTTFRMKFLGSLYIVVVIAIAYYSYYSSNNVFTKSIFEKINYKAENYDFYFECSDCHNLIPPFLLPKESWVQLMKDQHNHYNEDLELDASLAKTIENYIVVNSSEKSTRESSYYLTKEIKKSKAYTITKTNYWKKIHSKIPKKVFDSDLVETKVNCVACHKGFEQGLLSDINIKYPPQ
ncbi:MAG: cytochrome b/b6 domain-containing protein [Halarcobacter sp.]